MMSCIVFFWFYGSLQFHLYQIFRSYSIANAKFALRTVRWWIWHILATRGHRTRDSNVTIAGWAWGCVVVKELKVREHCHPPSPASNHIHGELPFWIRPLLIDFSSPAICNRFPAAICDPSSSTVKPADTAWYWLSSRPAGQIGTSTCQFLFASWGSLFRPGQPWSSNSQPGS